MPLAWADEAELSGELGRLLKTTDLVLTKEKQAVQWLRPHTLTMSGEKLGGSLSIPPVVDLTEVTFDDFSRVTEVFNYLQQILEGLSDERSGVYRYPGME